MPDILIKRGSNWANQTLDKGEMGLDLTNEEIRIGTSDNQSFSQALLINKKDIDYGDLDV